jgi:integrase
VVGTVNPVTGKQYLGDGYEPRTVRHSNAVLRGFYEFWIEQGQGPLVNPVVRERGRGGGRANAYHNPLEPHHREARLRYNPKLPKRRPREMPEQRWAELFGALRSKRDRALLALAVSNGARAAELLGMRGVDVDWGKQLIRVRRKGTGAEQWLPASSEAFVWLRLYLADLGVRLGPNEGLWWTLRRRDHGDGLRRQPMTYEALRAVFRRVNTLLGTNWSMHDLRHTAALRMSRDEGLSLRDMQTVLGHAHLSTTADVYLVEAEAAVIRRVSEHLDQHPDKDEATREMVSGGYDADDLAVLLGGLVR